MTSIRKHEMKVEEQPKEVKSKAFTFKRPGYRYTVHGFNLGPKNTWVSLQMSKENYTKLVAIYAPGNDYPCIKGVDTLESGFGWIRMYANYSHASKELLCMLQVITKTFEKTPPYTRVQARQTFENAVCGLKTRSNATKPEIPKPSQQNNLPYALKASDPVLKNVRILEGPSIDPRRLLALRNKINQRFGH
jgi:hypothetical protein